MKIANLTYKTKRVMQKSRGSQREEEGENGEGLTSLGEGKYRRMSKATSDRGKTYKYR